jgi:alkanesulfonate monooxygenase SsuD/methylene tetrahydromethanopterin reductase-like flavin-dependent oxidoreductase (luciferase family)
MPVDQSLVGREFPPTAPYVVSAQKIGEFCAAIGSEGDSPDVAPATFPIVVAFDAMFAFLAAEQIDLFRIVHGDQKFRYERPIIPGDVLTATLRVATLRQIGGADIIGTTSEIRDAGGALVCSTSATLLHRGTDP